MKFFERLKIGFLLFNANVKSVLYVDSNKELAEDNSYLNYDDSTKILGGPTGSGFGGIIGEVASSTNPTILVNRDDEDTGHGSEGADQLSQIAGGKEAHRMTETTAGNDSLQHTLNGLLGQATGDEIAYSFNYETNKATSGADIGLLVNVTQTSSPGTSYFLDMRADGDSKVLIGTNGTFYLDADIQFANNSGITSRSNNNTLLIQRRSYTVADDAIQMLQGTIFSNTTGLSTGLSIIPTYNQASGDGVNTDLLINRTETAVGSGNQYFLDLQVDSSSKLAIDNNGYLIPADDLHVSCPAAKTLVLDTVVYEDLVLPLDFTFLPAVNAPNRETLVGNLTGLAYAVNDYQEFSTELVHKYKETSPFEFHIHGALNATVGGSDETVKFEIEYSIANMNGATGLGDVFPATTTINAEFTVPATTPDLTSIYIAIGADETGSFSIGATIKGRLRRIASSGTELAGDIFVTQVGVHYRVDTIGSRLITTK